MFAQRMKQLRAERNITQQELADLLRVGRSTVAGYEVKGKQPDNARLCQIADLFDVSVDYLLGHTDDRTRQPARDPDAPEPAPPSPDFLEAMECLERLSDSGLASALRCLQAICALDSANGGVSSDDTIFEKNA